MNIAILVSLCSFLVNTGNFGSEGIYEEVLSINSCKMIARSIERNLQTFKEDYNVQQIEMSTLIMLNLNYGQKIIRLGTFVKCIMM